MGSENPETQLELGEQDAEPPKRARGRPKGARNKAKETPQKQIEVDPPQILMDSGGNYIWGGNGIWGGNYIWGGSTGIWGGGAPHERQNTDGSSPGIGDEEGESSLHS